MLFLPQNKQFLNIFVVFMSKVVYESALTNLIVF
nr:MAG TPA: hypothetical protein [Caudoviricetes sp.]